MYQRATLRASGGDIRLSSDDIAFPSEFGYGKNVDFLKVFVLSYIKLLDDSPLVSVSGFKPRRCYMSFLRHLTMEDLRLTIRKFSDLSHALLSSSYSTGSSVSTDHLFSGFSETPVFKEFHAWYRDRDPLKLKFLLSFLLFGKKLEFEDDGLNATALRSWYAVEERLRGLQFDPEDLARMRNIIEVILPPLDDSLLLPKFGSGRVSEKGVSGPFDKFDILSSDPKLDYVFNRERPGRTRENGFGLHRARVEHRSGDVSRLKFVRKDIFKSRSICMEPNAYMYYQQEVLRWMVSSFEKGLISRFVNLADQRNSQIAAVHGSTYLCTDTIDLSSASDSVHVDLVRGVFPLRYRFYLLGTRTSKVYVPGSNEPVEVKKFAPMGSAVCFPVQCVIFTAACLYAALLIDSDGSFDSSWSSERIKAFLDKRFWPTRSPDTPFTWAYEPPVVYGDDIAVDSRHTDMLITILTRLGFEVNVSKSFTKSQSFRESCGVFAFDGEDVTPVQFRLPFFKRGNWDSSVYASIIGSINWANLNGFQSLGRFYLSLLKDYRFKYRLPFTDDRNAFGIYTPNKRKVPKRYRVWHQDYQSWFEVVQGITVRGVGKKPEGFDTYAAEQWWRSRVRNSVTPTFGRSLRIRPQETRLAPQRARCE